MTARDEGSFLVMALQDSAREHSVTGKERKQGSITPRKFTRFFTPRSSDQPDSSRKSSSRQALLDITSCSNTRRQTCSSPIRALDDSAAQAESLFNATPSKRRKVLRRIDHGLLHVAAHSDPGSTPSRRFTPFEHLPEITVRSIPGVMTTPHTSTRVHEVQVGREEGSNRARLKHFLPRDGHRRRGRHAFDNLEDWRTQTSGFFSRPSDAHTCRSTDSGLDRSIPFCTASCNNNSLVAVGDEEGRVRLVESAEGGRPDFNHAYIHFRPHINAVIDMAFSHDDALLATASGDQTARVTDMFTQQTRSILSCHTASVKQVKFQPGQSSSSVLATSGRDGCVAIWDLRCKASEVVVSRLEVPLDPSQIQYPSMRTLVPQYGNPAYAIRAAHRPVLATVRSPLTSTSTQSNHGEHFPRAGDISITALSFMGAGQEHLLLSASEANASVKLWDLRYLRQKRHKTVEPISTTRLPASHTQWRNFGTCAMSLSSDSARLYTLCKDNTVYTYLTSHLVLGSVPELSTTQSFRHCQTHTSQSGLGPIYGFQHEKFHATSFYVKSGIRPARNGDAELLAVGSSDGCAVLFPTDERYLARSKQNSEAEAMSKILFGHDVCNSSLPIIRHGTPLIRGHEKEVGALTWTINGQLITVGDDYIIRRWHEGKTARDLRQGGEDAGRRWGCGWAEVDPSFDADEC